jgi:hypothetical protein
MHELRGQGCQNGVAILLFEHTQIVMEMRIHAQTSRNLFGLINMACAFAHHIDFLQGDNVRSGRSNHIGDARRRNAPVNAKAAMHIPCEKADRAQ